MSIAGVGAAFPMLALILLSILIFVIWLFKEKSITFKFDGSDAIDVDYKDYH